MGKKKLRRVPTALKEILEVEFGHPAYVHPITGERKRMQITRDNFDKNGKEFEFRVLRIVKPEGVTMAQHIAAGEQFIEVPAEDKAAYNEPIPELTAEDLGVDTVVSMTPEPKEEKPRGKPITELTYEELKDLASVRDLEYKGNISKAKLIELLLEQ